MRNRVFLSYSHEDRPLAQFLSQELKSHDLEVWTDEQINPGEIWDNAILNALRSSDIYLPLLSFHFMDSDWNIAEVGAAYGMDKDILPVLLSGDLKVMPFKFREYQFLDARSMGKYELASKVLELIAQKPSRHTKSAGKSESASRFS
ncbi:MAG TPA: toll/interleukin-1 receptor domain-containing protein [Saprospiraceae bacterium]|nr:toll/interleukin-1 receptor domain-containing protein [Saprospiraceae bacterium]